MLIFILVLILIISLEYFLPRRQLKLSKKKRWSTNFLLLLTDVFFVRLLLPVATVETAVIAQAHNIGLLNQFELPVMVNIVITIIVFDVFIYGQHVLFHKVNLFWSMHRVHHTDLEYDVTTGIRFHPAEIVISMLIKMLGILILGPAVIAIVIYEIVLSSASIFTHGNLRLPYNTDGLIRKIFITPDMHRIHHSVYRQETDSNYGSLFSCWDRLFKTYTDQPRDGQLDMTIGLEYFRDEQSQQYPSLLLLPIKTETRSET